MYLFSANKAISNNFISNNSISKIKPCFIRDLLFVCYEFLCANFVNNVGKINIVKS